MSAKLTIPATDLHTIMCTPPVSITNEELDRLQYLREWKDNPSGKWLVKNETELEKLEKKNQLAQNGWAVSVGAETLLLNRYVKSEYGVRKMFSTSSTARGNLTEDSVFRGASEFFGCELNKNTQEKPQEKYGIVGIADVLPSENLLGVGVEAKSVEDFAKVHEPISVEHIWQCKAYCMIYGVQSWYLYRQLVPLPENILTSKAWYEAKNLGYEYESDEHAALLDKYITNNNNIKFMPLEMTTNVFRVDLEGWELKEWQFRRAKCEAYYNSLSNAFAKHKAYLNGIKDSIKSK
jgi:hypothetical protein